MAKARQLEVLIQSQLAGKLSQDSHGALEFSYYRGYDGPPLSLSMPLGKGPFTDRVVRPYLFGLLPDDRRTRLAMGREHGVYKDNPFLLLEQIGWDCPGAVQFCQPDHLAELLSREGDYVPLTIDEMSAELMRLSQSGKASWSQEPERWSLGGMQKKFALAYLEGQWWRCEGSAATTHIIKPGVLGYPLQALNECVCERLAKLCGIPASTVSYQRFGDVSTIVVERYDRIVEGMQVTRLHQEDLCQSLSVMPESKYAEDGGPAAVDLLGVLGKNEGAPINQAAFTAEFFFNYLVGANDAHAKNYSILLGAQGPAMAPLYDCASGLPYGSRRLSERTAAMRIGGEGRFTRVRRRHVERYAQIAGLSAEHCWQLMRALAKDIDRWLDEAFDQLRGPHDEYGDEVDELRSLMRDPILRICTSVLTDRT